jgi:hypothetical protein
MVKSPAKELGGEKNGGFMEKPFYGADTKAPLFKKIKGLEDEVYLAGYPGKPGCFSAIEMKHSGTLDIAIHLETPEEIADILRSGGPSDALYVDSKDVLGWGYAIIPLVEKELALSKEE